MMNKVVYNISTSITTSDWRLVLCEGCGWCLASQTDHSPSASSTSRRQTTKTKSQISSAESTITSTPVFSKVSPHDLQQ